jgi:ubiquinone/menaquinone biosynthesis C-methylase UbiE
MAEAYSRSARSWAAGPDVLYRCLGDALVAALEMPLGGADALDVGAGTGAVTSALVAAGANVVAVDIAHGMLALDRARRPPAVAADATLLPFRARCFDVVVSGCCLSHLTSPRDALSAMASVLRPRGVVAVSALETSWRDPMKAVMEGVLGRYGWRPPSWYVNVKQQGEVATGSVQGLDELARSAGLVGHRVTRSIVPVEFGDAAAVVEWRLGMAQVAPFVTDLTAEQGQALRAAACRAVADHAGRGTVRVEVPLLVLTGRRS